MNVTTDVALYDNMIICYTHLDTGSVKVKVTTKL